MSKSVEYKEFFDCCIKSTIEEVIRDYYESIVGDVGVKDLKDLVDYDMGLENEACTLGAVVLFARGLITPMKFIEIVRELAVPEEQIQEFFKGAWVIDGEDRDRINKTLYEKEK